MADIEHLTLDDKNLFQTLAAKFSLAPKLGSFVFVLCLGMVWLHWRGGIIVQIMGAVKIAPLLQCIEDLNGLENDNAIWFSYKFSQSLFIRGIHNGLNYRFKLRRPVL